MYIFFGDVLLGFFESRAPAKWEGGGGFFGAPIKGILVFGDLLGSP